MSTAAAIRQMMEAGLTLEQALVAVEAFEAHPVKAQTKGAIRQQRYRERHKPSQTVTSNASDECDDSDGVSKTKGSPTPLPKTQPSETPPSPPMGAHGSKSTVLPFAKPNGFDRFWEAYPKKIGKGDAKRKFDTACQILRAGGHAEPLAVLLDALRRVKPTWEDPQFIPYPATWLHQGRWEDEPELPPPRAADEAARHLPAVVAEDLSLEEIKARIAREAAEIEARRIQ